MPKPDRLAGLKKWLTKEEWNLYGIHSTGKSDSSDPGMNDILESLVASRASEARKGALLKEHQYDRDNHCVECGALREKGCYPDCAIAAELEGG